SVFEIPIKNKFYMISFQVKKLPIKSIVESNSMGTKFRGQIAEKANRMLELNEKLNQATSDSEKSTLEKQIEETDQEIDQLVYQLYELTDEEIQNVEHNFEV
ncbi:MAG: hypothetical protein ABEH43_03650, partial [Flavobacteriales bacterium]